MPKYLVNLETFAIYLLDMFWAILEKSWATFYSVIWSHCSRLTIIFHFKFEMKRYVNSVMGVMKIIHDHASIFISNFK